MFSAKEAKEKRKACIDQAMAIRDECGGQFSPEQRTQVKELMGQHDNLDAEIRVNEAHLVNNSRGTDASGVMADLLAATSGTAQHERRSHNPTDGGDRWAFARSFGERLQNMASATREPGSDVAKRLYRQNAEIRAILGGSEGIGADGGFLTTVDEHTQVLEGAFDSAESNILSRCSQFPVSGTGLTLNACDETDRANGSRWGGIKSYWLGEGAAKSETNPTFRKIVLSLKKMAAIYYCTDELLADAPALGAFADMAFRSEILFRTEDAIIRGTGAGQPSGILGHPATVSVAKEPAQAPLSITEVNISDMWSRLLPGCEKNAVWLFNKDCETQLRTMSIAVGAGGGPVYMPMGGLSVAPFSTLMGRPAISCEFTETLGTEGDIILGDFSQYIVGSKAVKADSSIHVEFLTDQTVLRWVFRVDGQPKYATVVTPYKGANDLGAFVTLKVRA